MHKRTFCYITNQLEGGYENPLWSSIFHYARKHDIGLIALPCKPMRTPVERERDYNILYDFISDSLADGFIVATQAIGGYVGRALTMKLLNRISKPIISIGMELESTHSIVLDNYQGMRLAVEHLVNTHATHRPGYLRGERTNFEENERFRGYCDVLRESNIDIDENCIFYGNFSIESGEEAALEFIERGAPCDSLSCANDQMVVGFIRGLKKYAPTLLGKVRLTGFDNTEFSKNSAFTTINQPLDSYGELACSMLSKILDGEELDLLEKVRPELIIRESCGCSAKAKRLQARQSDNCLSRLQGFEQELAQKFILAASDGDPVIQDETLDELKAHLDRLSPEKLYLLQHALVTELLQKCRELDFSFVHDASLLFSSALEKFYGMKSESLRRYTWHYHNLLKKLSDQNSVEGVLHSLETELNHEALHIRRFTLCFYNEERVEFTSHDFILPQRSRLVFDSTRKSISLDSQLLTDTRKLLSCFDQEHLPQNGVIVYPIFKDSLHYGYALIEITELNGLEFLYESICEKIGFSIYHSHLLAEKQQAMEMLESTLTKLKTSNIQLKDLSLRDSLTSLYNRRGFMAKAEEYYSIAKVSGACFLIFYIDLDELKMINDSYGHDEGDEAIIAFSKILTSAFRDSDILSRLGGDEFTALAASANENVVKVILNRIDSQVKSYNQTSNKPYTISYSYGYSCYVPDNSKELALLINEADTMLYEQKREKKQG